MIMTSFLHVASSSSRFIPHLKCAYAFASPKRGMLPLPAFTSCHLSLAASCRFGTDTDEKGISYLPQHRLRRWQCIRHATTPSPSSDDGDAKIDADTLTMENIYSEWTLEDDRILYANRHLSTVRLASLLGRGINGVESRLKKICNVESAAYARLFGAGNVGGSDDGLPSAKTGLTPVKVRRISSYARSYLQHYAPCLQLVEHSRTLHNNFTSHF